MKLCKDCVYYLASTTMVGNPEYAKCSHPATDNSESSLVTGEIKSANPYCVSERNDIVGRCGKEAILFELIQPSTPSATEIEDFETTVGDDIAVRVSGEYDPPDASTGWNGGYSITKVWLVGDASQTDIYSLLTCGQVERIEEATFNALSGFFDDRR